MKPLTLEMQAFGSYPGKEVVDFTVLQPRGLFIVTGETGTGKTTIFDAMSYALFNEMPSKSVSEIRSHHASAQHHTYARFTFEADGTTYVVQRSPEYQRLKERGAGTTTEKAKVSLEKVFADGSTESLATKVTDVKEYIDRIVGLTAKQFQKVVLLPQGEFTAFLIAGSQDREALLAKLFGGEIYEEILVAMKVRMDRLNAEVASIKQQADERLTAAIEQTRRLYELLEVPMRAETEVETTPPDESPDVLDLGVEAQADEVAAPITAAEVRTLLERAEQPLAEQAARAEAAAAAAHDATLQSQAAADAAKRFADAAVRREQLAELASTRPAIEAADRAAQQSRLARPVVKASDSLTDATKALNAATEARKRAVDAVIELLVEIECDAPTDSAPTMVAAIAEYQAVISEQRAALTQLESATEAHRVATAAVATLERRIVELTAERSGLSEQAAALSAEIDGCPLVDVERLEVALEVASARETARSALDVAADHLATATEREGEARTQYDAVLRQFVGTQAPRLAAALVPGEPCAVCGSREHPAPAVHPDLQPIDFAEVEAASRVLDQRAAERHAATGALQQCRSALGDAADLSLTELQAATAAAAAALTAGRASNERRAGLVERLGEATARQASLDLDVAGTDGSLTSARATLATANDTLAAATEVCSSIEPEAVARAERVLDAAAERAATLHDVFSKVTTAAALVEARAKELAEAIDESVFDDVQAAQAALLDPANEQMSIAAAEQHRSDTTTAQAALALLEQQGIPDSPPDTELVTARAAELGAARDRLAEVRTAAGIAHSDGMSAITKHEAIVGDSAALFEQRNDAARVHQVCAKGGSLYTPLRRWVLGRELDRVTAAANVHLARMAAGRYRLRRRTEVLNKAAAFGLELEVLDGDTGVARSTTSLSGGEQFQASLALALGLADVVSQGGKGNGRHFEALFIDEGFGTLDDKVLDQAIDTLYQLHATGRMVGAITHVEAMKQRLHPGIVVTRLPNGGSTLTVNP